MGRPEPLADALETLSRGAAVFPMHVNPAAEALYIVNPLHGGAVASLFATHPPLEERVRRLRALVVADPARPGRSADVIPDRCTSNGSTPPARHRHGRGMSPNRVIVRWPPSWSP